MRLAGTKLAANHQYRGFGDQLYDLAGERPSLDLNFANTKTLTDSATSTTPVTFTRASSGTYVDSQGVIRTATTNLQRHSEDFAQGLTPSNATLTANQGLAPNGTITADQFLETTANGLHSQEIADHVFIAGAAYTFSCYAKSIGGRNFAPGFPTLFGSARFGFFNLSGGGSVVNTDAGVTASIQAVGDGWYRCSITSTCVTGGGARVGVFIASGTSISYVGDAAKGLLLWGAQLEQSSTVGEYIPTTSTINSAPRFDHAITSSVTNLLLRSEEFDNASWSKIRSTVSANGTLAPNGTTTADKFIEDTTASNTHIIVQGASVTSGTTYAASFYLKAGERSSIYLSLSVSFAGGTDAIFNASTGVATNLGVTSCSMTPVGNGWYRCVAIATANATGTGNFNLYSYNGSTIVYTGDGTSGIFIWGAQLEQSSTVGEYVQTTSAPATASKTESLGLLVEEQRTNLGLYSDVSQSSYIENITVSANNATSPDGTSNATKLTSTTTGTNNSNFADRNITVSSNTVYTFSCYLKQGNTPLSSINLWYAGGTYREVRIAYTWSSKTIALTGTAGTGFTGSATEVGNGWVRLVVSLDSGNNTSTYARIHVRDNTTSGVVGDFVYVWGRQIEAGSFPTSYIPTTTAAVTRSADVASISGSNFGTFRTNLLLRSEEFDQSPWTLFGTASRSANATTAPNGTLTADSVTLPVASGIYQSAATTAGITLTFSVYIRCATTQTVNILINTNLGDPTIKTVTATTAWQRFDVTKTTSAGTTAYSAQLDSGNGNTFFVWGAQLETGSTATAYIPTTTAAVTVFESSWYRQDEGTVFYDGTVSQGLAGFPWFYNISNGTVNNSIGTYQFTNGIYGSVVTGGVAAIPDPTVLFSPVSGSTAKHAFAVKTSDTRAAYNGSLSSAQTSTVMPTVNTLSIGTRVTANRMTGTIRRLTYWPQRLPNSTLQQITQ